MSDQRPLLETNEKRPSVDDGKDDEDESHNKQVSTNSILSDWLQCFGRKKADKEYIPLAHQETPKDRAPSINVRNLFRYATPVDRLLLVICFFCSIVFIGCVLYSLVIFGRLAGLFVNYSSIQSCSQQLNITAYSDLCPLGIELNSVNYEQLHPLCNSSNSTLFSTSAQASLTFREKVMSKVHGLIIAASCAFFSTFLSFIAANCIAKAQTRRMKVTLFRSLLQRNIPYMDSTRASQLNSTLFDNVKRIEEGIGQQLFILYAILMCMVASLIISFVVNWTITLIILILLPIVIGVSFIFSRLTAREAANELNTYASAGHIVQEVFSSIRTVLSLNGTLFEQKRYEKELESTCWSTIRKGAIFGVFMGWLSLVTYIVYASGFLGGALLITYGNDRSLDISDILVVVTVFAQCMSYFGSVGAFMQTHSNALGAGQSVLQLIDEGNEESKNESQVWQVSPSHGLSIYMNGDIEFDNVTFTYPTRQKAPVLRNISLIARAGQTTALVGASGCGKSTCISLLLRFYQPSSGEIKINGESIDRINLNYYRQRIGIVSQEPILFGMSIYENIRLGKIDATRVEVEEVARQANAHHFIMRLPKKYDTLVGERGIQLSGGEKQRVALARALIKQPTILILDEATSALDNISEKLVQEALDRACKNRTTIVIAHRLSTIQNADCIYVLEKGDVIETGTHESLMANEESQYHKMVRSQQLDEHEDEAMNIESVFAEDEQQTFERTRLLSGSQEDLSNKDDSKDADQQSIYLRLILMNRPEWITILIGCIACMLSGAVQPLFAVLLSKLVGSFQQCVAHTHGIYFYSLVFFFLGILLLGLHFFDNTAFAIAGSRLVQRVRAKAFSCLLRQEVAYFDQPENSSGAVCARLASDASALQELVGTRMGIICETVALTVFGYLLGFWFSWQLTVITTIPFLAYLILFVINVKHDQWSYKVSAAINEKANGLATEVLQNLRTIKQLSCEGEILRMYSEFIHEDLMHERKATILPSFVSGCVWLLDPLTLALIYWRALVLVERNEIEGGDIVMVYAFATFAMQALRIVGMLFRTVSSSMVAAKSFFALFDRVPAIDNGSNEGEVLNNFQGEIEFRQVTFAYPVRPSAVVLNDFRLKIPSGQRVALVGSSGCGKSTTVQLIERFYDSTEGNLYIDGIDIRKLNLPWIRSRLGLVSQEPILFDLTIAQNITYGLENVSMDAIIEAATKANIHDFIECLPKGYDTNVGTKGSLLSGGEKQRIAIARVLARKPKILLLDEATSAMDSQNEQIVQEAIDQAQTDDPTRTSLIIAHRLSTIRSCDLICVVERGRLVESGTHTELKNQRGVYYRMLVKDNS